MVLCNLSNLLIIHGDTELRKLSDKIVHLSSEIGVSFKRWVIVVFGIKYLYKLKNISIF